MGLVKALENDLSGAITDINSSYVYFCQVFPDDLRTALPVKYQGYFIAISLANRAQVNFIAKNHANAMKDFTECVREFGKLFNFEHPLFAIVLKNLAELSLSDATNAEGLRKIALQMDTNKEFTSKKMIGEYFNNKLIGMKNKYKIKKLQDWIFINLL